MKTLALFAITMLAFACGGGNQKKDSALVNEGSDVSPNCCCKTIPQTDEKEIQPVYNQMGRMECSTSKGDCVDDVQCNATGDQPQQNSDGVPPPPPIEPSTDSSGIQ
jgi:hypothetical protein